MSNPSRTAILAKTHKILKKHYQPVPIANRPLLEQLLFACCLENARYEEAESAFKLLTTQFFDLNEVRVTTVRELAELLRDLPNPQTAAAGVKGVLQGVFESNYSFDIESLKKQNLGQAINTLKKIQGITPFVIAYATQSSLGGHAIPLDEGALRALIILGVTTESEVKHSVVPGLERAIPKNKGVEFGSLLHQLGADLYASPMSTNVHKTLLEINPLAKERLPKRQTKKPEPEPAPPPKPPAPAAKGAADGKTKGAIDPKAKAAADAKSKGAAAVPPAKKGKPEERKPQKPVRPLKKETHAARKIDAKRKEKVGVKRKAASQAIAKRKPR